MRRAVLIAFGLALPALAMAWQFPDRPVDADRDCRPNDWSYTDEGQEYVVKRDQGYKALDYGKSCDSRYRAPSREWGACYSEGMRRQGQFMNEMNDYRSRAIARFNQARQQCVNVAHQNAQLIQQQRDQVAENQRRQQQANADAERRQREAQAEVERQRREQQNAHNQAAAKQQAEWARLQSENDARVRQQQAQQQQQAQIAQQAARQAQVQQNRIAQAEPSPFNPATRNEGRVTPEVLAVQRAQARAAEEERRFEEAHRADNVRNLEVLQGGKVLRDFFDVYQIAEKSVPVGGVPLDTVLKYDGKAQDYTMEKYLDKQLNPQGYKDAGVDMAVLMAKEENKEVNKAVFVPEVITRIQNISINATGSVANDALGKFDAVSWDQLSNPAPQPTTVSPYSPAPASYNPAPVPVISLDQLAGAPPPSPADACKAITITWERDQCVVDQCKRAQFTQHQTCKSLTQ